LVNKKDDKNKKTQVVVIRFTESEKKQINKKAGAAVLMVSPFLRQHIVKTLSIKTTEES